MAAELLSDSLTESISNGFVQYNYTQVYQVILSSRTDGPVDALLATGLPKLGVVALLGGEVQVWCQSRSPTRANVAEAVPKWIVTCTFSNASGNFQKDQNGNPVTEPANIVKQVDITFQEYAEPVTDATLDGLTIGGPKWGTNTTALAAPPWLTSRLSSNQSPVPGPVTNSAGKVTDRERSDFRKVISITKHAEDWDNTWDSFLKTINSDEITIEQRDSQGVRLTQTYAVGTLLMQDVVKEDVWKDARLYFRVRFVMFYNKNTWVHSEPDRGLDHRVTLNQYKPDGTQYIADDLTEEKIDGDFGFVAITAGKPGSEISLSEPVAFNGSGMEQPTNNWQTGSEVTGDVFLNWNIYESKAFTGLGL